ncbi:MAG: hypothetical protein AAGC67_04600 [Myxococcota bacterium]
MIRVRDILQAAFVLAMAASIGAGFLACASLRLQQESLPAERIAILHWEDRSGEKRREAFEKAGEAPPLPTDPNDPERQQEAEIRAYLRADDILQIRKQTSKYPGRLMLLDPRTSEMERVEEAPPGAIPLAWSPDRTRLLLASDHRTGKEQLYELHLERRDLSPLTFGPAEHPRGGYAADGSLYVQRVERVQTIGASANTLRRLGQGGRVGSVLAENVSPGTLRVLADPALAVFEQVVPRPRRNGPTVFESYIATAPLSGGGEASLLLKGREPTITPDGQWIVFASQSTAGYRLRRMRPDGTSRVPIGPGATEERMPTVSPDGNFIAFVQTGYGRRRLTVRRFDGKDERVLLTSGWTEYPVW